MSEREYETIADAAARLGVHHHTIRRRIAEGKLPAYRFGPRLLKLNPAEVDDCLRAVPTAKPAA